MSKETTTYEGLPTIQEVKNGLAQVKKNYVNYIGTTVQRAAAMTTAANTIYDELWQVRDTLSSSEKLTLATRLDNSAHIQVEDSRRYMAEQARLKKSEEWVIGTGILAKLGSSQTSWERFAKFIFNDVGFDTDKDMEAEFDRASAEYAKFGVIEMVDMVETVRKLYLTSKQA